MRRLQRQLLVLRVVGDLFRVLGIDIGIFKEPGKKFQPEHARYRPVYKGL